MSARLTIVTYNNEQAIVIPSQAIEPDMTVAYREAMDKPVQRVKVTTGQSTAQGVEVFGLKTRPCENLKINEDPLWEGACPR